jgi:large subunit ribosomal protein L4
MATLTKINLAGETVGQVNVPDALAAYTCAPSVVHACVVAHEAALRRGTASTLTKGGVDKTGRKPWAQKGTGRARAGYFASPLWRGGGVVFGPKPRLYDKKVNRMMKRQAFYAVLAKRVRDGNVRLIQDWQMERPQAKAIAALKKTLGMRTMLCVATPGSQNGYLSARNVKGASFLEVGSVGVHNLLTSRGLVIAEEAWKTLQDRFATVPEPKAKETKKP